MKFIRRYAWIIYLSAILSIAGLNITDWKWWIICVPVIILVQISKNED